jgi:hypothetical protein
MVLFSCSGCGQSLQVSEAVAGRPARCPRCGRLTPVPAPAPQAVPVAAPVRTGAPEATLASAAAPRAPGAAHPETATVSPHAPTAEPEATVAVPPQAIPVAVADPHNLSGMLAPPQQPDEMGRLGPYRVLKVLGRGGMGIVFLAEDVQLKRLVALKAMLPSYSQDPSHQQRFLREAQAAAAVEHDHIVAIHHTGQDRGVSFLAMPLLKGESLEDRIKREGKLPTAEAARIGAEIAQGLAAAHARGLIHRDIKPGNVWLEGEKGRVKILDFGLARVLEGAEQLTQPGAVLGTPAYMAPEQVNAETVDHRADLFSLGCVLYRMATGKLPFRGTTPLATLTAVRTSQPVPPQELNPALPPALIDLIAQLLAKEPAARPPSAQAVAQRLHDLAADRADTVFSFVSPPDAKSETVEKRSRRRIVSTVVLTALVLMGLVAGIAVWRGRAGKDERISDTRPATVARKPDKPANPVPRAEGEVIVARDGSGQYASLRQAILEAKPDTTIRVRPGRYTEEEILVHENLTIIGDGTAGAVVIEFAKSNRNGFHLLAKQTVLRNLTIRCHKGIATQVSGGRHRMEDCALTSLNEDRNHEASLLIGPAAHLLLRRCQVHGTVKGCGVVVRPNAHAELEGSEVYDNGYQGVWVDGSGQVLLRKCRVHDNKLNGVLLDDGRDGIATLDDCELAGNGYSGASASQGAVKLRNCRVNHNVYFAVGVEETASATVEGCDLTGNARGAWYIEPNCKVERRNNKE